MDKQVVLSQHSHESSSSPSRDITIPYVPFCMPRKGAGGRVLNKNVSEFRAKKGYLNFPQQPGGPWGIAVAPNGHTFIVDHISHQIHVFDEQRKHIRSFGQQGSGYGQLNSPIGIAVDADGLVYVCN